VLSASAGTAVVMLTSYCQDNMILKSLNAGAKGYLIKDVELAEVKRTIRAVYRGHSVLDPKVAPRVIANATTGNNGKPGAALSERDVAIIRYVAGGLTNKEIASLVHLSSHTIKDRLEKIASTFDVRSRRPRRRPVRGPPPRGQDREPRARADGGSRTGTRRHRPHALGDPRSAVRRQCAPAHRLRAVPGRRPQRHHREPRAAAAGA